MFSVAKSVKFFRNIAIILSVTFYNSFYVKNIKKKMDGYNKFQLSIEVNSAKKNQSNTFTFHETLNDNHYPMLMNAIRGNDFSRTRFCFVGSIISEESINVLKRLSENQVDIDGMLFFNSFSGNFPKLFDVMSSFENLSILSFTSCNLKEVSQESIGSAVSKMKYLRIFSITGERCTDSLFNEVCKALTNKEYLECFQWKDTILGDPATFGTFFRSCPSLHTVDLSQSALTDDWRAMLISLLDENWKLEYLILSDFAEPLKSKILRNKQRAQYKEKMPSAAMYRILHDALD